MAAGATTPNSNAAAPMISAMRRIKDFGTGMFLSGLTNLFLTKNRAIRP
jgi:hypothetical protein